MRHTERQQAQQWLANLATALTPWRLVLVRAAARAEGPRPEPYLSQCIAGALRHYLRDRALLVSLPAKRRDAAPWW
jgi:hypothetical protein